MGRSRPWRRTPTSGFFSLLIVIAASAVALVMGIGLALDLLVPLVLHNEIHALAALIHAG